MLSDIWSEWLPFPLTLRLAPSIVLQSLDQNVSVLERPILIAISGCTSSGKTTLCYLLVSIFSGISGKLKHLGAGNDNIADKNIGQPITKTVVLHQDSYFKPKQDCPVISWKELYPHITDNRPFESRNAETKHYTIGIRMNEDSEQDSDVPCGRTAKVNSVVVCNNILEIPTRHTVLESAFFSKQSPQVDCKKPSISSLCGRNCTTYQMAKVRVDAFSTILFKN
jgi:hypothetical protein